MINNIIFDFGDIFINLDKPATIRELSNLLQDFKVDREIEFTYQQYEKGLITTEEFVHYFRSLWPLTQEDELKKAWNAIILDFPQHRLDFIENLSKEKKYNLYLLSNTNELHIQQVKYNMGEDSYERFKRCFDGFYLSHEINFRKPDSDIYNFVLETNQLKAEQTLFIDDTEENVAAADALGLKTWHLIPGKTDVTELFELNHFK